MISLVYFLQLLRCHCLFLSVMVDNSKNEREGFFHHIMLLLLGQGVCYRVIVVVDVLLRGRHDTGRDQIQSR